MPTPFPFKPLLALGLVILVAVAANLCTFSVSEHEQVILTQFGRPIGQPIRTAGLHFRTPFTQTVNRLDKRILEWDGKASEMPTRDKLYIVVDTFARWQIADPLAFFTRLRDERSALSRLDDIIGSEVRNSIARHDLIELVRTVKDRQPSPEASLAPGVALAQSLPSIREGRTAIERQVLEASAPKMKDFGITLLDVRFMRINYNARVSAKIHERMISERQQIAARFRSEGEGEAAKILGNKERDLRQLESEAYRDVQLRKGEAEARAAEIYTRAYNQNAESVEFYQFLQTMDAYKRTLTNDTTLILTTDSEFLRYLKQMQPAAQGRGH